MSDEREVLVFDLGGVLIEFRGFEVLAELLPGADASTIRSRWIRSPAVTAFERGEIAAREFGARFVEEWPVDLAADAFIEVFRSWALPLPDEALTMLSELSRSHRIACLSNCNEVHWDALGPPIQEHFDEAFVSFQMGLAKPDARIFERMLAELDVAPERVTFFDDTDENVSAARALGIRAERVRGLPALRSRLRETGRLR